MKPKDRLMMGPSGGSPVLKHTWFTEGEGRLIGARSLPRVSIHHGSRSLQLRRM